MYFCSGKPMQFCSGVDTLGLTRQTVYRVKADPAAAEAALATWGI
jgi:hypothetical protein